MRYRQKLIDTFVNSVYLYDDKIIINYNFRDGAGTVSLKEVENSDLVKVSPPVRGLRNGLFKPFLRFLYKENHAIVAWFNRG